MVGVLLVGLRGGAGGASGVLLSDVFRRRCAGEDVAMLGVSLDGWGGICGRGIFGEEML